MKVIVHACRDCRICTRPAAVRLFVLLPRLVFELLFRWNLGLFRRRCPICGHLLKHHSR